MNAGSLPLVAVDWAAPPGVKALVTTRAGGVSAPPRDALNLGSHVGDAEPAVMENRGRLRAGAALPAEPRWLNQVHGVAVADLDALPADQAPQADAALSTTRGTVCAVLTADCLPVFLAAADGSGVAIAHAGWRGLAAGVVENTVEALRNRVGTGARLVAWLGPAISARHFEVGGEVRDAFLARDPRAEAAFVSGREGRWSCDLHALARQRLAAAGIDQVGGGTACTYAEETRFFSHRRDVQHRGLASTGRIASLIWMQA